MPKLTKILSQLFEDLPKQYTFNTWQVYLFNEDFRKKMLPKLKKNLKIEPEEFLKMEAERFVKWVVDYNVPDDKNIKIKYSLNPSPDVVRVKGDNIEATVTIKNFKVEDYKVIINGKLVKDVSTNYEMRPGGRPKYVSRKDTTISTADDSQVVKTYQQNNGFWRNLFSNFKISNKKAVENEIEGSKKVMKGVAERFIDALEQKMDMPPLKGEIAVKELENGVFEVSKGKLVIQTTINPTTYFLNPTKTSIKYDGETLI